MSPCPTHRRILITLALAVLLIAAAVPTVSASGTQAEIYDTRYEFKKIDIPRIEPFEISASEYLFYGTNFEPIDSLQTIFYRPPHDAPNFRLYDESIKTQTKPIYLRNGYVSTGPIVGTGTFTYFKGDTTAQSYIRIDVDTYDKSVATSDTLFIDFSGDACNLKSIYGPGAGGRYFYLRSDRYIYAGAYQIEYYSNFRNTFTLTDYNADQYKLTYSRDGSDLYDSKIVIYDKNGNTLLTDSGVSSSSIYVNKDAEPYTIQVYSNIYQKWYTTHVGDGEPWLPPTEEPDDQPLLRTGSVTMTDHNGTTISGFAVTAVNYYTGEEYNVATQSDVAVMTLPMDRTTEIRNPQTGVYEEAPAGYYTFYGQAPGYKMLAEDGIRVTVMPEKYGSYKLCDILVSSDSGPLTGKHKFQIRSRSDFSVLQTGTISAKSRTTGIWYNTTVVDGLATLILPYDTSDALSEHAGHYYVYATSPGYEDSDYGTQIIVSPRTVSEVRTILLTPIGGVPTPGNVTLRIQAISETGSGIPNAEIFIAGVIGAGQDVWDTYTASSSGYLAVSVPGNSTYDIVARGVGYYDSSRRIQVFTEDPALIEIRLYLSGAPTLEPTVEPTGWITPLPTTQPPGGIPDEDDGSGGFLMEAVRGIGNVFGVGFATAKIILGMLLALSIGFATAKQLRGGAAEFGLGLLGGTILGILIGLIPVWTIVVLLLVVGLYIGNRYVGGGANNG